MTRSGVRMTDMLDSDRLETRLRTIANGFKKRYGDLLEYDVEEELSRLKAWLISRIVSTHSDRKQGYTEKLRPYICDQVPLLRDAQKDGGILVEGANALMVCIESVKSVMRNKLTHPS